ncbi:MAG: rhomboid family intramembrane serine protease [Flavobacteriia bacterium]|nr:rhomboid family intramembrane serine protease [Flavobacteriia bacterium]
MKIIKIHSKSNYIFGNHAESILLSLSFIVVLWLVYVLVLLFPEQSVQLGIQSQHFKGLIGILFSPLIHSPTDVYHIINNSVPAFVLLYALFYFYRKIAFKIFLFSWLFTGLLVWIIAKNDNAYHIGLSGVIYALFSFLLFSGTISKFKPLQALSLFVVFLYGSMVWGIFPQEEKISWEGHLSGFVVGIFLTIFFRKQFPVNPKYQYEIEKELGIEPPDLEEEWKKIQEEMEYYKRNDLMEKD